MKKSRYADIRKNILTSKPKTLPWKQTQTILKNITPSKKFVIHEEKKQRESEKDLENILCTS